MKRGAGELFATHRVILIEHVIDPMDDGVRQIPDRVQQHALAVLDAFGHQLHEVGHLVHATVIIGSISFSLSINLIIYAISSDALITIPCLDWIVYTKFAACNREDTAPVSSHTNLHPNDWIQQSVIQILLIHRRNP